MFGLETLKQQSCRVGGVREEYNYTQRKVRGRNYTLKTPYGYELEI